jgi:cell division protein FtsB
VAGVRARRARRGSRLRILVAAAALAVVGFLYYKPLRSYLQTGRELAKRQAEVRALRRQKHVLEQRLAGSAGDAWIVQSARRLGLVEPGERLFIVKGIEQWERAHGIGVRARKRSG